MIRALLLPTLILLTACDPEEAAKTSASTEPTGEAASTEGPAAAGCEAQKQAILNRGWFGAYNYFDGGPHCSSGYGCLAIWLRLLPDGTYRRIVDTSTDGFDSDFHEEKDIGRYTLSCDALVLMDCAGRPLIEDSVQFRSGSWSYGMLQFQKSSSGADRLTGETEFLHVQRCR